MVQVRTAKWQTGKLQALLLPPETSKNNQKLSKLCRSSGKQSKVDNNQQMPNQEYATSKL